MIARIYKLGTFRYAQKAPMSHRWLQTRSHIVIQLPPASELIIVEDEAEERGALLPLP